MPKRVDHEQRRRELADAVRRIAVARGMQDVTFREVAAEAGVSVALVQHYFGTKAALLVGTLEIETDRMAGRIRRRLGSLDDAAPALDRLRCILGAFLPTDRASRTSMVMYHEFAALALTDLTLRGDDSFSHSHALVSTFASLLREAADEGAVAQSIDADLEARAALALMLGLSIVVLLDGMTAADAQLVLDAHMARL